MHLTLFLFSCIVIFNITCTSGMQEFDFLIILSWMLCKQENRCRQRKKSYIGSQVCTHTDIYLYICVDVRKLEA